MNEDSNSSNEKRFVNPNSNSPEVLTNNIYTPAFLREHLGKLMRVEFLIGILQDVGVSYILLRSIESGNLLYCDLYSIKFVAISDYPYRIDHNYQI